jgi:4-hydroxy 2-oxovalerate aldolase
MQKILVVDSSLRDGNHAVKHQIPASVYRDYARGAEKAGIEILVVGHGNGLGASSLHLGHSLIDDDDMLNITRRELNKTKLGAFVIPGFATYSDMDMAVDNGADVLFIATHCTEANVAKEYIKQSKVPVYGVLMMSHMVDAFKLLEQAKLMESYKVEGVFLMDSAGASLPNEVKLKISVLVEHLKIPVGFHAHNNLGMAVANSLTAIGRGATMIDATTRGLGAGAGNCQLEALVALLHKIGYETGLDLRELLKNTEIISRLKGPQEISPMSIMSGINGVFSGFAPHVERISKEYKVEAWDVFNELGKRKVVAGQEDQILEVAMSLS